MIEKIKTYGITHVPTVYDDEAYSTLELANRTASKVNEVIDAINGIGTDMPKEVSERVDQYIENGTFDQAINEYANDLENRLDIIARSVAEGDEATSMHVEIVDARMGHRTLRLANDAIRGDVMGYVKTGAKTINLFDPFTCYNKYGLENATGDLTASDDQWCTDFIPVKANGVFALCSVTPYKVLYYNQQKTFLEVVTYGTPPTVNGYMRLVFKEIDIPFAERWNLTVCDYASRGIPAYLPYGVDPTTYYTMRQIEGRGFRREDFVIAALSTKTRPATSQGTSGDFLIIANGEKRLVLPFPIYLKKGTTISAGSHLLRIYTCDANRENPVMVQNGAGVYTSKRDQYAMLSIAHSTNEVMTEELASEIIRDLIVKVDLGGASPIVTDTPIIKLGQPTRSYHAGDGYYSDMAFCRVYNPGSGIGEREAIMAFTPSDVSPDDGSYVILLGVLGTYGTDDDMDDYDEYYLWGDNPLYRWFGDGMTDITHTLGHVNSVDINKDNILICGSGSSDPDRANELYITNEGVFPRDYFNTGFEISPDDRDYVTIALPAEWGYKCNVIWGTAPDTALVITNDGRNVREIYLTKAVEGHYTGYQLLNEWSCASTPDVVQGATFCNGKLYTGLGHAGIKILESTLNDDGTISHRIFEMPEYKLNADGVAVKDETRFPQGITIRDGVLYLMVNDGWLYSFNFGG